jgi:polyribonucleotide nucleotidyltransferase
VNKIDSLIWFHKKRIVEIRATFANKLGNPVFHDRKLQRDSAATVIKEEDKAAIIKKLGEAELYEMSLNVAFEELQAKLDRNKILDQSRRVDIRGLTKLRPIECATDLLPVVHGCPDSNGERYSLEYR